MLLFSLLAFADEWRNFRTRIGRGDITHGSELISNDDHFLKLRFWASYRGQTWQEPVLNIIISSWHIHLILIMHFFKIIYFLLNYNNNPVRGMMYYRKALMLQSYLERTTSGGSGFQNIFYIHILVFVVLKFC